VTAKADFPRAQVTDDRERRGLIVVVGSVNADYLMSLERRPGPGETVADGLLEVHPGGKGANQAVAAARCGAAVQMVGCVGVDEIGQRRIDELVAEGIDIAGISRSDTALTGVAFITLTPDGENAIAVAPGANALLSLTHVERAASAIASAAVLVAQLEIPLASVARAVELAGNGTVVLFNCAPYRPLPSQLLRRVDILVVNALEAASLSGRPVEGVAGARRAAAALRRAGPGAVVITLGAAGAIIAAPNLDRHVATPPVHAIDTTGAGDAFVGAVAAQIASGASLESAVAFGIEVGSATTTQRGADPVVTRPAATLRRLAQIAPKLTIGP
jgi:ribokinase